ncbi:hypothetical protein PAXRUDRAFT_157463, partial [Paxillus rubicundulus Ve08.2h10]
QCTQQADMPLAVDAPQAMPTATQRIEPTPVAKLPLQKPNVFALHNCHSPQHFHDLKIHAIIPNGIPSDTPLEVEFLNFDDVSDVDEEDNTQDNNPPSPEHRHPIMLVACN